MGRPAGSRSASEGLTGAGPDRADTDSSGSTLAALIRVGPRASLAFQDPHDRNDGVPIPCRRRRAEQLIDLAKIADGFHVTTVEPEDESLLRGDHTQEPFAVRGKCDGKRTPEAGGFRQDADEANDIRA